MAGVPTVFVPNENPMMDEQLSRARFAEDKGLGLCLRTGEVYKVGPHLERMLDRRFRTDVQARLATLDGTNGGEEAATFVEELAYTLRADRDPMDFWTPA